MKILILLITFITASYGAIPFKPQAEQFIIGKGTNTNLDFTMDIGSGATNPFLRWNTSQSRITFSNDGTNEKGLGGFPTPNFIGVSAVYTALLTDDIIQGDTGSGGFDIDLPTAAGNAGKTYTIIKKTDVGLLTVDPSGAETIKGLPEYIMGSDHDYVTFVSDGTNWRVTASDVTIYAKYQSSAGQSVPTGVSTIIDYATQVKDTHNAVTVGAAWHFTAPMSGLYQVRAGLYSLAEGYAAGAVFLGSIRGVGANVYMSPSYRTTAGTMRWNVEGTATLPLLKGEIIDVTLLQDAGGNRIMDSDVNNNFIEITGQF